MVRNIFYVFICIFLVSHFCVESANAYDRKVLSDDINDDDFDKAKNYIKKADEYRGENYKDFAFYSTVIRFVGKKEMDSLDLVSYVHFYKKKDEKEFSRDSLVRMTSSKFSGTLILQKGSNMWFYKKGTANAIRISPAQRLLGGASYSDIAATNFSKFYDPIKLEKTTLKNINVYKITLKKVEIGVAYNTIILYLREDDYRPLKSEFFTPSGRLMKTMYFRNFGKFPEIEGTIVKELAIVDAIKKKEVTIIKMNKMQRVTLPSVVFTQNGMKKF